MYSAVARNPVSVIWLKSVLDLWMENVYYGLAQIFMTDWDKQYMIFQFAI